MFPPPIQTLINLFTKFPGIGPRQATRFVFYLLKKPQGELDDFAEKIKELKDQFHYCPQCFIITDNSNELCSICRDSQRNKSKICVVEKDSDIQNIESANIYDGLYFILEKIDINQDSSAPLPSTSFNATQDKSLGVNRINNLIQRIKSDQDIKEIIIATSPTTLGDATALYVEKSLRPLGKKINRLGRGLPSGGEIEYADEVTLGNAFKNRG